MRMTIFRPTETPKNEYTLLVEKYKTMPNVPDRVKLELIMDLQKLANKKIEDGNKRIKRHNFYHFLFKPKFLLPAVYWMKKKFDKDLPQKREDIPDELYNVNFQILYDTWQKTFYDWSFHFRGGGMKSKEQVLKEIEEGNKHPNNSCYYVPDFFVKFAIMVGLEDTAYREMLNVFMFNLQAEMNKRWNPEIKHNFPMYTVLYDQYLPYFCEWLKLNGGGSFTVNVEPTQEKNKWINNEPNFANFCKQMEDQKIKQQMEAINNGQVQENKNGCSESNGRGLQAGNIGETSGKIEQTGPVQGSALNQDCERNKIKRLRQSTSRKSKK